MKKAMIILAALGTTGLMALIGLVVAASAFLGNYGTRLEFTNGELYFTENVELAQAEALRTYLEGMMADAGTEGSFQLDRDGDDLVVRMVTKKEAYETDDLDISFMAMEALIQVTVFEESQNVRVELTNEFFQTQKVLDNIQLDDETVSNP